MSTVAKASIYVPEDPPQVRAPSSGYGLMLALLGCFVVGLTAGAQYVAWRFGFHANLGPPWLLLPAGSVALLRFGGLAIGGVCVLVFMLGLRVVCMGPIRRWLPLILGVGLFAGGLSLCGVNDGSVSVYAPVRFLGWGVAYGGFDEASAYADIFTRGLFVGSGVFVFAAVCVLMTRRPVSVLTNTGSHGTAGWSGGEDLVLEGLSGRFARNGSSAAVRKSGVLIGRQLCGQAKKLGDDLLMYRGEGHLITVAPTRSGKGTGGVIPNLLTYPGSVLVTDPKGENYAVTARHRSRALGNTVRALDPFDQLGAMARQMPGERLEVVRATYNPMDLIDPRGEDWLECASLLAEMLVLPVQGRGGDEVFWNEEAKGLLTGLILYVAASELDEQQPTARRTLARVRELLTLPKSDFKRVMQAMEASALCGGLVRRAASRHLQKEDRERSGVVSTAQSHTHFLDSPRMAEVMARSSVNLSRMKREATSIYLVLPAHYLDTYSRWLRLIIACAIHDLARTPGHLNIGGREQRVLFLLDEFANLGRMNPVLRAVSLMAGYGVSIWTFLQDLSQLKGTYPDRWGTFLANADVLQAFGTNDHETARYLSDLTGEATVFVGTSSENVSRSRGRHTSRSQGAGRSYGERGRKLLTPDEVRRLPPDEQLLFIKGTRPVRARKINYLADSEFMRGGEPVFDENPMHHVPVAMPFDDRLGMSREARCEGFVVEKARSSENLSDDEAQEDFILGLKDPDLPRWMRDDP